MRWDEGISPKSLEEIIRTDAGKEDGWQNVLVRGPLHSKQGGGYTTRYCNKMQEKAMQKIQKCSGNERPSGVPWYFFNFSGGLGTLFNPEKIFFTMQPQLCVLLFKRKHKSKNKTAS